MKRFKELVLALALAISFSVIATAQEAAKNEPKKKAESCCTMECCKNCPCCKGESCAMKSGAKDQSGKHGSCCGDSCEMKNAKNKEKQG